MEREREITKLVNVLHRIARAAAFSSWVKRDDAAVHFCVAQYNRILKRLKELEPAIVTLYGELEEGASPHVLRMAAHDLAAYFEDEMPHRRAAHSRRICRPHHVAFAWANTHGRHC